METVNYINQTISFFLLLLNLHFRHEKSVSEEDVATVSLLMLKILNKQIFMLCVKARKKSGKSEMDQWGVACDLLVVVQGRVYCAAEVCKQGWGFVMRRYLCCVWRAVHTLRLNLTNKVDAENGFGSETLTTQACTVLWHSDNGNTTISHKCLLSSRR